MAKEERVMKIDTLVDKALKIAESRGGFQKKQVNRTQAKQFLRIVNELMWGELYKAIRLAD